MLIVSASGEDTASPLQDLFELVNQFDKGELEVSDWMQEVQVSVKREKIKKYTQIRGTFCLCALTKLRGNGIIKLDFYVFIIFVFLKTDYKGNKRNENKTEVYV